MNATVNYRIWKGLSIGLGIEPTVFFNSGKLRYNDASKTVFDFPVLVKVGYELKNIGFAVSYKQGFKALYDNYMLNSEKNKELQISVFVPIFK